MSKHSLFLKATLSIITFCFFVPLKPESFTPIACHAVSDLKNHITPGCIIAADFDNTLFEAVDEHHGSVQRFYAGVKYLCDHDKIAPNIASEQMLKIFNQENETALIKPIEPETIPLLQSLEKSKTHFLVITARSIISQTFRQLQNLQQSSIAQFSFKPFHLCSNTLTLPLEKESATYQDGVFFSGLNNNKGDALIALFDKLELKPTKVIFIDDQEKNVTAVAQAMIKRNIPFVGLRYAYLDEKVKKHTFNTQSFREKYSHA